MNLINSISQGCPHSPSHRTSRYALSSRNSFTCTIHSCLDHRVVNQISQPISNDYTFDAQEQLRSRLPSDVSRNFLSFDISQNSASPRTPRCIRVTLFAFYARKGRNATGAQKSRQTVLMTVYAICLEVLGYASPPPRPPGRKTAAQFPSAISGAVLLVCLVMPRDEVVLDGDGSSRRGWTQGPGPGSINVQHAAGGAAGLGRDKHRP